jgi:hypothetical protein
MQWSATEATKAQKAQKAQKEIKMKIIAVSLVLLGSVLCVSAQETPVVGSLNEKRVALTEAAVALDASGAAALEATLRTTALNGAPDAPVSNIRMVVRNRSALAYAFVSGSVTFYDAGGVRCGEGVFKADSLAVDESFETDSPGVRIRCQVATWRLVASHLVPRTPPNAPIGELTRVPSNLVISIDGETHPIQLDRPLTLTLGEKRRTIIVRTAQ